MTYSSIQQKQYPGSSGAAYLAYLSCTRLGSTGRGASVGTSASKAISSPSVLTRLSCTLNTRGKYQLIRLLLLSHSLIVYCRLKMYLGQYYWAGEDHPCRF